MLGGMLLMISPAAALLVAVLAAPTILVVLADTTPHRTLTRTVILFSLAGAIEPLRAFLLSGHDMAASFAILARPAGVMMAWLSGGCGWLLNELFCLGATLMTNMRHAGRRAALEAMLLDVRQEWTLTEEAQAPAQNSAPAS